MPKSLKKESTEKITPVGIVPEPTGGVLPVLSLEPKYVPGLDVRQQLESATWPSGRVKAAKASLNSNLGVGALFPPTKGQLQKRLNTWWQLEGQFIPRNVLNQMGVVGGSFAPLQDSINMHRQQKANVVKDFLGIKRPESKDPLADFLDPTMFDDVADPSDIDPGEEQSKLEPEQADILKATPVEDLEIIKQTIIDAPLDFDVGLLNTVKDEIAIREQMPGVIENVRDKPLSILVGTQLWNNLTGRVPEFLSRKRIGDFEEQLGIEEGSVSQHIRAVARVREQIVAQDPTLLAQIGGDAGNIIGDILKFAVLPDPSKIRVFAGLSKTVKAAIGIGSKAGLIEVLRAPGEGETFTERIKKVGTATAIGVVTGAAFSKTAQFIGKQLSKLSTARFKAKFPQFKTYSDDQIASLKQSMSDWGAIKDQAGFEAWQAKHGTFIKAAMNDVMDINIPPESIKPIFRVTPKGFRAGFADIEQPAKLAIKATKVVAKAAAKTKEGIAVETARKILALKVQPSKAVKPTKIITKAESASLKEIGVLGEGEKLTIVANPQLKKAIQARENEIATLKTRRNELMAEKQFVKAKTKAEEIKNKEVALAEAKGNAEIKLETTVEGLKEKAAKIDDATVFKEELRNDAISMVTGIESGLRKDFIIRANKIGTKSQKPETALKLAKKLAAEVKVGIEKFERKVAIKDLENVIADAEDAVESLPSPQKGKLRATLDSISTKKISKQQLDPDAIVRDPDDLDVKARRGRVQLLGKDLESLQVTTQRLAGELAGQLQSLEPEVEEALRLPNARIKKLNLLTQKNAHEMGVEDIKFVTESLKNTIHEGKVKGKLLTNKGSKPLEGVLEKAPSEVRPVGSLAKPGVKKSSLKKVTAKVKKFVKLDERHADTTIESITKADSSAITKILDTDPHTAQRKAAERIVAWRKIVADEFKGFDFSDTDQLKGVHTVTLAGVELKDVTLSELMSLEMDMRSPRNLLRRLNSEGIELGDREMIPYKKNAQGEDVVDRLQELKDAVAIVKSDKLAMKLLDFTKRMNLGAQAPTVNEKLKLIFGYDIAQNEDYWPLSVVGDVSVSGPKGEISTSPENQGRYTEIIGSNKPLRLRPWDEVFLGGLESDATVSETALAFRNARVLLTDHTFQTQMRQSGRAEELKNLITIFSRAQGISTSKDIFDVFGGGVLKRIATSALGLRLSTAGVQVMSFYTAQAITGNQGAFLITPYKKADVIKRIRESSALMDLRWMSKRVGVEVGTNATSSAFDLLFFGKTKGLANKGMKFLVDGDMVGIQNIYEKLVIPELLSKTRTGLNVDPLKWEGQGMETLDVRSFSKDEIDTPEFIYAAARRLEYVVRRSQPMFDMLDRPVSMSSPNFGRRSFLMFRTALNAADNVVDSSVIQFQKGLITAPQLTQKLGSVVASMAAVAVWKRGLKWAIATGWTVTLAALGIFKFREPKEKKETIKDLTIDTVKNLTGLNPITRIVANGIEIAANSVAGDNYPWGRKPVENPVIDVLNSGGAAGVDFAQALADIRLWDAFVVEVSKGDVEFNEQLEEEIASNIARAIKSGWGFGAPITGFPIVAPVQEFIAPLFRDSDIKIIREVTFGDVDNPQKFSEGVFKLYEQRRELRKKEKTTRLTGTEEVTLSVLDNFVKSMNQQAELLKETQEHQIRQLRFSAAEQKIRAVQNHLDLINESQKK